jgi:DNA-binding transcriptional MerR regulator
MSGQETSTPGLGVAAVARRLGLAPATVRTWDRRYGLGPTGHAAGSRRRYGAEDVARLERMRQLLLAGQTTAEAARMVVSGEATSATSAPSRGGGRTLALPGADAASVGLARAALAMDEPAVRRVLRDAFAERGTTEAWHEVICPVLVSIGQRWEATGEGGEIEHLLADVVATELRRAAVAARRDAAPASGEPPRVLLACVDGDYHSLPLLALAAVLAEYAVPVRILGGSVPARALTAAVTRTGPAVAVLYAQLPVQDPQAVLDAVPTTRPPVSVVVGGAGWGPVAGGRATVARHLEDAAAAVRAGLGRS